MKDSFIIKAEFAVEYFADDKMTASQVLVNFERALADGDAYSMFREAEVVRKEENEK
mgnify:CR=1 FL=1